MKCKSGKIIHIFQYQTGAVTRPKEEEHTEDLYTGPNAQIRLAESDEAREQRNAIGAQMMKLQAVEAQELLEERARRQRQPPRQVRGEDHELVRPRVRRDLGRARGASPDLLLQAKVSPSTEPPELSAIHTGAHPGTRVRH